MKRIIAAVRQLTAHFLLVCVFYFVGQTLLRGVLQEGMDCCIGFGGVIGEIFKLENWSLAWLGVILIPSAVIVLLDWFTPRGLASVGLLSVAVFAGAYYQAMFSYDHVYDVEQLVSKPLYEHLSSQFTAPIYFFIAVVVWLLPVLLLLMFKILGRWSVFDGGKLRGVEQ